MNSEGYMLKYFLFSSEKMWLTNWTKVLSMLFDFQFSVNSYWYYRYFLKSANRSILISIASILLSMIWQQYLWKASQKLDQRRPLYVSSLNQEYSKRFDKPMILFFHLYAVLGLCVQHFRAVVNIEMIQFPYQRTNSQSWVKKQRMSVMLSRTLSRLQKCFASIISSYSTVLFSMVSVKVYRVEAMAHYLSWFLQFAIPIGIISLRSY